MSARTRLPDERKSLTHHFSITDADGREHDGYVMVGFYVDGRLGEVFVEMAKAASGVKGLLRDLGVSVSLGLQHGVPLSSYCDKFIGTRYDPAGFTPNPEIPRTTSPTDYIARWLRLKFVERPQQSEVEPLPPAAVQ